MEKEYWQSIHLFDAMNQYSGYLDTQGLKDRDQAAGRYAGSISALSFRLIESEGSADAAIDKATNDLLGILRTNREWRDSIAAVKDDLVARIYADGSKSVWSRRLGFYALPIIAVLCVLGYVGAVLYNKVTLDQPATTIAGLRQHAMAFDKTVSYDANAPRRGGFIGMIIRSVIEPSEEEVEAARDFASLTGDAYGSVPPEERTCIIADPQTGEINEQAGRRYIAAVAVKLLAQPEGSQSAAKAALLSAVKAVDGCGEE